MTGADSPVMADSSTVATPSMTSPSAGIISPARTWTTSPFRSISAGTFSILPLAKVRLAIVWVRVFRRASAWALPRPSAMASAKLAKSTVNQSQSATCKPKPRDSSADRKNSPAVVIRAPTSVTNMTGFFIMLRGLSFLKEAAIAWETIRRSNRECFFAAILSVPQRFKIVFPILS